MISFGSLRRKFMAQFPVIGPHANIECELMLANMKPLALLPVFDFSGTEEIPAHLKKCHSDRIRLDQAAEDGRLLSETFCYHPNKDENQPLQTVRIYGQKEHQADFEEFTNHYRAVITATSEEEEDAAYGLLTKEWGEYLGYRKRDQLFFNLSTTYTPNFHTHLVRMNAPFQSAYLTEMRNAALKEIEAQSIQPPEI